MSKLVKIETEPFTEQQIDEDLKRIDFVYLLHYSKKRSLREWIREHQTVNFLEEEIIYVHRYPKDNETFIGIKRLRELSYFI